MTSLKIYLSCLPRSVFKWLYQSAELQLYNTHSVKLYAKFYGKRRQFTLRRPVFSCVWNAEILLGLSDEFHA